MKKHLNTLFINTEGAYLKKEGQALVVRVEQENKLRLPLHNLDGIVCIGDNIMCSPALMGACAKAGVSISFLNPFGGFVASVVGFTPGNVLLRRQQFRVADCESQSLIVAKQFITGKIANSRSVLLRAARDTHNEESRVSLRKVAKQLGFDLQFVERAKSLDQLRGQEGDAANKYFGCLNSMISQQLDDFRFTHRSRRPPLDRINALLSFLYSMLTHDARSACESTGLDAAVGFLHRDRPGRPSLALDLIEEFRSFLVDRLVLSLINRKQVSAKDFEIAGSGAVMLKDKPRKAVLAAYQKRKQDVITHPFLNEKTTVGLLIHLQARLLARHLRGDLDAYPPFVWR